MQRTRSGFSKAEQQRNPPNPPRRFDGEYTLGLRIGSGAFASVHVCEHIGSSKKYAVKVIEKSSSNADLIAKEITIAQSINHPNLVRLIDWFETETKVQIVVELMTGKELFHKLCQQGSLSEEKVRYYYGKILRGVSYLHEKGIVHRDLKPENVLFESEAEDSELKVADFGLADKVQSDGLRLMCGTPEFIAPEVIRGEPYRFGVDMWSLGVMLYTLLCGFPPFYHQENKLLYRKIMNGEFEFPAANWSKISPLAKDLISRLLKPNPVERYTAQEALQHPWILNDASCSSEPMPTVIQMMRQYNAQRRFKKAIAVVVAMQRITTLQKHASIRRMTQKSLFPSSDLLPAFPLSPTSPVVRSLDSSLAWQDYTTLVEAASPPPIMFAPLRLAPSHLPDFALAAEPSTESSASCPLRPPSSPQPNSHSPRRLASIAANNPLAIDLDVAPFALPSSSTFSGCPSSPSFSSSNPLLRHYSSICRAGGGKSRTILDISPFNLPETSPISVGATIISVSSQKSLQNPMQLTIETDFSYYQHQPRSAPSPILTSPAPSSPITGSFLFRNNQSYADSSLYSNQSPATTPTTGQPSRTSSRKSSIILPRQTTFERHRGEVDEDDSSPTGKSVGTVNTSLRRRRDSASKGKGSGMFGIGKRTGSMNKSTGDHSKSPVKRRGSTNIGNLHANSSVHRSRMQEAGISGRKRTVT